MHKQVVDALCNAIEALAHKVAAIEDRADMTGVVEYLDEARQLASEADEEAAP